MSRRNAPENFFSAVKFWGKSVRKNRPLVPRSNIAGSWTGGVGIPWIGMRVPFLPLVWMDLVSGHAVYFGP